MNDNKNKESITEIPDSIKKYFKEKNIKKDVLSLYLENEMEIQSEITKIDMIKDRDFIVQKTEITEEQENDIKNKGKIILDNSLKLWSRLVGLFSLDEVKKLLSTKKLLDVKVYGLEDIVIHKKESEQ